MTQTRLAKWFWQYLLRGNVGLILSYFYEIRVRMCGACVVFTHTHSQQHQQIIWVLLLRVVVVVSGDAAANGDATIRTHR